MSVQHRRRRAQAAAPPRPSARTTVRRDARPVRAATPCVAPLPAAAPVPWGLTHLGDRQAWALHAFAGGTLSIALLATLAWATGNPFLFPSLGASAFIFFARPGAAPASPRNAVLGHGLALLCAYAALTLVGLESAPPALLAGMDGARVAACALALGLTGAAMLLADTPHPPAGATALIVALGLLRGPAELAIAELAVALLALVAIALNRAAGVPYPVWRPAPPPPAATA